MACYLIDDNVSQHSKRVRFASHEWPIDEAKQQFLYEVHDHIKKAWKLVKLLPQQDSICTESKEGPGWDARLEANLITHSLADLI